MSEPSHAASPQFVKCPACGTKLGVRAEDAGQRGQCHQCGKVFRIGSPPPSQTSAAAPAATPAPPPPRKGLGDYDNDHLHPVSCLVCQTLMYATDEQVGTNVKCPDCGAMNLAKRREAKKAKPSPIVADGDEYQLDESSVPPPTPRYTSIEEREARGRAEAQARTGRRPLVVEPPEEVHQETRETSRRSPVAAPLPSSPTSELASTPTRTSRSHRPAAPVIQGLGRMLLTSEVMVRWFALSLLLTLILFFVGVAMLGMGMVVFLPAALAAGCFFACFWILSASSLLVAILTQSANGADELSDPPPWFSLDVSEAAFIAVAAIVSGVPAWLATKLTPGWPWEANAALGVALWLAAFPFVALSSLEQGSPLAIFSPRLAASLGRAFFAWLAYYVVAWALLAGAGFVAATLLSSAGVLAVLPLGALITAVVIVYFRLVGRLGWWIADLMPPADQLD